MQSSWRWKDAVLFWKNSGGEKCLRMLYTIAWYIWQRRNFFIFENKRLSDRLWIQRIKSFLDEMERIDGQGRIDNNASVTPSWHPPDHNSLKINVDGGFWSDGSSCCGAVARDERGHVHGVALSRGG